MERLIEGLTRGNVTEVKVVLALKVLVAQAAGSLLVALAIAAVAIAVVTAHFRPHRERRAGGARRAAGGAAGFPRGAARGTRRGDRGAAQVRRGLRR